MQNVTATPAVSHTFEINLTRPLEHIYRFTSQVAEKLNHVKDDYIKQ